MASRRHVGRVDTASSAPPQSNSELKENILRECQKLVKIRRESDKPFMDLIHLQESLMDEDNTIWRPAVKKEDGKNFEKLRKLYTEWLSFCEKQTLSSGVLLELMTSLVSDEQHASEQPIKVEYDAMFSDRRSHVGDYDHPLLPVEKTSSSALPPLCGSIPAPPNYVVSISDIVAAKITKIDTHPPEEEWILAYVLSYDRQRYSVQDVEASNNDSSDGDDNASIFSVAKSDVIPLPLSVPDKSRAALAEFPKNALVLALFPGTTCFYKATVASPPSGRSSTKHSDALREQSYLVLFEDDDQDGFIPEREVAARFVLAYPEKSMNKRRRL